MNLTELEVLIEHGIESLSAGAMEKLLTLRNMMKAKPEEYPLVRDAVLNRLEMGAEVYVTLGLLTGETDREEFRGWAKLACVLGVSLEDAKEATDRGADRAQKGFDEL